MNRRIFLSAVTPACLAPLYFRFVEPNWFEVSHTDVRIPGVRPRRILHISDIHISDGMHFADIEPGLRAGLATRPDLICLTGDFVSRTSGFDRKGLERLLRMAADTAPSFAVLGNHDGGRWIQRCCGGGSTEMMRDLLTSSGVRMLHNESAVEGGLTLVGVADFWSAEMDVERAFRGLEPSGPTVVLCHNPDGKKLLQDRPWHLMLSGHTHGGQARIPGLTPAWSPVQDKRFLSGLYSWEGRQLFITRGLGSPKHIRAFCRPEVSVLHFG